MTAPPPMRVTARAKVNLHLDVLRRRQDGFHEIETIFQSVDLFDRLEIELTEDGSIDIQCDASDIPTDDRNLCHRAVVAMRDFVGPELGARIRLHKGIPQEAGLGGGSADAAAVLLAVCKGKHLDVPIARLEKTAHALGSDVPFMLHGGTMLGRGRGEILTVLSPLRDGFFVLVKPDVNLKTAEVYGSYNFRLTSHKPRLNLRAANSVLARLPRVPPPFRNALENVVCPSHPRVSEILEELLAESPCFASMTGSGSTLFALFETRDSAVSVSERFAARGLFSRVVAPARRSIDFD